MYTLCTAGYPVRPHPYVRTEPKVFAGRSYAFLSKLRANILLLHNNSTNQWQSYCKQELKLVTRERLFSVFKLFSSTNIIYTSSPD